MCHPTKAEMLKTLRAAAKERGLTFKEQNAYINGKQAYIITKRKTGEVLSKNHTLQSAFDNQENCGFISAL